MSTFRYPPLEISGTGPIEFVLDSIDTQVSRYTSTPSNSRPLPVIQLDGSGNPAGVAALDYGVSTNALRTAAQIGNATGVADFGSGAFSAQTIRAVLATDQPDVNVVPQVSYNAGNTDATTQRVVVATDQTAFPVTLARLNVVDFIDTTPVLDTSSSNIPASASTPLTIVSSLAANVKAIQVFDTTGEFLGIYSDPAGSPVLLAVTGPGMDSVIELTIASTTTIGVRNMANSAISTGKLAINFLG